MLQLYGFATARSASCSSCCSASPGSGRRSRSRSSPARRPAELRRAIVREDIARFEAIPGIGRKTAQRVVLELKDKLGSAVAPSMRAAAGGDGSLLAREALVELGWSLVDAERALADVDEELPVEEQVRAALRQAA